MAAGGERVAPAALRVRRAADLAGRLAGGSIPFARLVECRRAGTAEGIVMDLDVETPQDRSADVRPLERLVAWFGEEDDTYPEVLALRESFPFVLHLNLRDVELPRSLCLYDQPWPEVRLTWTAPAFVRRIRTWLSDTARGALHRDDQPLEPFLAASGMYLVLPPHLLRVGGTPPERLRARLAYRGHRTTLVVGRDGGRSEGTGLEFVATGVVAEAREQGAIRRHPSSIAELHAFLSGAGCDLLEVLRGRLFAWRGDPNVLASRLVILVWLPKVRRSGASPEGWESWAFVTDRDVASVGEAIGRWRIQDGVVGLCMPMDRARQGEEVGLAALTLLGDIDHEGAARLSGADAAADTPMVAVGAGALGSQVLSNLVRSGFGCWAVVDKDVILPHNLVRHQADGGVLGQPKAEAAAAHVNRILSRGDVATAHVADILASSAIPGLPEALEGAALILDMAASIPVSRHLALDVTAPGRRIAVFLSPSGRDLVLLMEDRAREVTLDLLEMQYYRALMRDAALEGHLAAPTGRIRYARSCRDVTSTIPQDCVATLAGIAARAVRQALTDERASIRLWRTAPDLSVTAHSVPVSGGRRFGRGPWSVHVDEDLLLRLGELRAARLPRETGGVLIGSCDLERSILYVVDTIPSPPDSTEYPHMYVRGVSGLEGLVERTRTATGNNLYYVGEWHSHPDGCGTGQSPDDRILMDWITAYMAHEGLPGLMLIAGADGNVGVHLQAAPGVPLLAA